MGKRTEEYKKDRVQEDRLEQLNSELEPSELRRIENSTPPKYPITFIVGAPRSATTLTHQILAQTNYYSYISNFIARFWKVPSLGSEIAETLGIYTEDPMSFRSNFGRTKGWKEPHQFNYFWKKWLLYDADHQMDEDLIRSNINAIQFRKQLGAIEGVNDKPLLFKSLYTGMQIPYLHDVLEDIRVVVTLRHPYYQAQSNLLGRRAFFGNDKDWFSLKPSNYSELRHLTPFEQVVAQIYSILKEIESGIASLDSDAVKLSYYDQFMQSPREQVQEILSMINISSPQIDTIPDHFDVRNNNRLSEPEHDKLQFYVTEYFGPSADYVPFESYMRINS